MKAGLITFIHHTIRYTDTRDVTPNLINPDITVETQSIRISTGHTMIYHDFLSPPRRDSHIIIIIIIIIIKIGQQCKAGRERYTPYQSEDPSPTIPTYRQKEEEGKESRRL